MPTTTTCLGRVRWFDPDQLAGSGPSGPCCLHTHQPQKPTPPSISDAFGQTMIAHHPVDFQIFDSYQSEAVDNTAGVLVREVLPPPRRTLVHPSHYLTPPGSVCRIRRILSPFAECAEAALGFGECPLLGTQEPRVGDCFPCRECSKCREADVNANPFRRWGERDRLPLTRNGDIPLTRARPFDTHRLRRTLEGPVLHHLHRPYLGQVQGASGAAGGDARGIT